MKRCITALAIALAAAAAGARTTPVGVWKMIDDDGKTEKSLVRITESGGQLIGRIETVFENARALFPRERTMAARFHAPNWGEPEDGHASAWTHSSNERHGRGSKPSED